MDDFAPSRVSTAWRGNQRVTKSGTNQIVHFVAPETSHGQPAHGPEFLQRIIGSPKGHAMNNYGGTVGGPIRKNKLFYFFSWEGMRERSNYSKLATCSDRMRSVRATSADYRLRFLILRLAIRMGQLAAFRSLATSFLCSSQSPIHSPRCKPLVPRTKSDVGDEFELSRFGCRCNSTATTWTPRSAGTSPRRTCFGRRTRKRRLSGLSIISAWCVACRRRHDQRRRSRYG